MKTSIDVLHYSCQTGPKIVCFLTQSVQLTLSSVQLTVLECVMWSSKMSWNRGKNEQICAVKFQNFLGAMPPDHSRDPQTRILGRGYGARHPQTPPLGTPALRASVPRSGPSAPPSSLSVCIVDILRYFRPCQKVLKLLLIFCNKNVSVWLSTVQEVLV